MVLSIRHQHFIVVQQERGQRLQKLKKSLHYIIGPYFIMHYLMIAVFFGTTFLIENRVAKGDHGISCIRISALYRQIQKVYQEVSMLWQKIVVGLFRDR